MQLPLAWKLREQQLQQLGLQQWGLSFVLTWPEQQQQRQQERPGTLLSHWQQQEQGAMRIGATW